MAVTNISSKFTFSDDV